MFVFAINKINRSLKDGMVNCGNDTVNGAGAVTQIYLGGNIRYTDVTRDLDVDDGKILIAGPRDFCGGARVRTQAEVHEAEAAKVTTYRLKLQQLHARQRMPA